MLLKLRDVPMEVIDHWVELCVEEFRNASDEDDARNRCTSLLENVVISITSNERARAMVNNLREMVEEDGRKLFTLKQEIEAGNEHQREREKKYEEQKREYGEQNSQHLRQLKLETEALFPEAQQCEQQLESRYQRREQQLEPCYQDRLRRLEQREALFREAYGHEQQRVSQYKNQLRTLEARNNELARKLQQAQPRQRSYAPDVFC